MYFLSIFLVVIINLSCIFCLNPTLVLLDNWVIRETHSLFFKNLQEKGFELTFKVADDPYLKLIEHGMEEFFTEFGGTISISSINDFIDHGGNIFVTASSSAGEAIRELTAENGLEVDEEGTFVIDHFNYDIKDKGDHTLIIASSKDVVNASSIVGDKESLNPILYRGAGIISSNSSLVIDILTASSCAYSYSPLKAIKNYPHMTGKNTVLVSAFQARNNARFLISGSIEIFSNEFFRSSVKNPLNLQNYEISGNEQFSKALCKWVFKEEGVLRFDKVYHHRIGETYSPKSYTIMDEVLYEIVIETLKDGKWISYDSDDIQLEFTRIDPFIRIPLKKVNGKYVAQFRIPDVYGVYKFVVDYKKIGFTYLYSSTQVPIRPLQHFQYERMIRSAFPYYVSAFSMMAGVFLFSFVFLYYKDTKEKSE